MAKMLGHCTDVLPSLSTYLPATVCVYVPPTSMLAVTFEQLDPDLWHFTCVWLPCWKIFSNIPIYDLDLYLATCSILIYCELHMFCGQECFTHACFFCVFFKEIDVY